MICDAHVLFLYLSMSLTIPVILDNLKWAFLRSGEDHVDDSECMVRVKCEISFESVISFVLSATRRLRISEVGKRSAKRVESASNA